MKIKIFICLLLLVVNLIPDEQYQLGPTVVSTADDWWNKTTYSTCDVCHKQVPNGLLFKFQLPFIGVKTPGAAIQANYMKPYAEREYLICYKCIFKALKLKPKKVKHGK